METAQQFLGAPPKWRVNIPTQPSLASCPAPSPLLLCWFTWYCRRYIRRHFHSLRVSQGRLPTDSGGLPLVVFTNHASWWDPLVGLVLKDAFFPGRQLFAPIDEAMLQRYRMFARLGFFGVEQHTSRGASQFLRTAQKILCKPNSLLAITPQGRFSDVRERPVRFEGGLGHLAVRCRGALFVPVAMEFVFWEERLPEILVRFGEPVEVGKIDTGYTPNDWTDIFEQRLTTAQNLLAGESQARDSANFRCLLRGGSGQGGIYDWWRGFSRTVRGENFNPEHGNK